MYLKIFSLVLILSLTFLIACSTSSKNRFLKGELILASINKSKKSSDKKDIIFKRYSWFQEMALVSELLIKRVGENSTIRDIFSKKELEVVDSCNTFFVLLSYSQDTNKITYKMIREKIEHFSYKEVIIPDFKANIKLHPDYDSNSFRLYNIVGFCGSGEKQLDITFPAFPVSIITI